MQMEALSYILGRALYAQRLIAIDKIQTDRQEDYLGRHYMTTCHGLAAMGFTNDEIRTLLKEAKETWDRKCGDIIWPYSAVAQ